MPRESMNAKLSPNKWIQIKQRSYLSWHSKQLDFGVMQMTRPYASYGYI